MLKKVRNILIKIVNIISVLLIVASLGILLTVVMNGRDKAPSVLGYSMFRVVTGSMEPTIPVNSLIVVHKASAGELLEGDVISFYSRDPSLMGQVNTHRVLEVEEENGKFLIQTKGDANNIADKYPVYGEDVIGKVIFCSLLLGKVVSILSNPIVFIPLIIIPLAILVLLNLIKSVKLAKQLAKEEEEAAVREAIEEIKNKKLQEAEAILKEAEALNSENNKKEEVSDGGSTED